MVMLNILIQIEFETNIFSSFLLLGSNEINYAILNSQYEYANDYRVPTIN